MKRVASIVVLVAVPAAVALAVGCQKDASRDDLGTVIYRIPQVPGADKAYPLPPLAPEKSESPQGPPADNSPPSPAAEKAKPSAGGSKNDRAAAERNALPADRRRLG